MPTPTRNGLLVYTRDYTPLRAFSQGGCYWDKGPQQLIRESPLAEFLPPVEMERDDQGQFGRFHRESARRDRLSSSKPLGRRGVPPGQLLRLKQAVKEFKQKAAAQDAQPENRQLIDRFQLPDLNQDPELYRLAGPWWNRRLEILWGCERNRNSSLAITAAADKLPPDTLYNLRRILGSLLALALLALSIGFVGSNWDVLSAKLAGLFNPSHSQESQSGSNQPPSVPAQGTGTSLEQAQTNAAQAEMAAQKAQADAAKAQADADRARQQADQARDDVDKKKKAADAAAHAAAKAAQAAKLARDIADRAKAAALANRPAARQTPEGRAPASPQYPAAPPTTPNPSQATNTASQDKTPASAPSSPTPASASPRYEIVLADQGQPSPDGTMQVSLEVRSTAGSRAAVPVQTWYYDNQTATAQDRLQARLKGGDYPIKAIIVDPSGNQQPISAVITVEPGKVITTGGKVSLRNQP